MKPEQTPDTEPIRFSTNVIIPVGGFEGSRFIKAGDPSPYRDLSEVPELLRGLVATGDSSDEELEGAINYEPGVVYQINSDGFRGRSLGREAARLHSIATERAILESLANQPLPPDISAALEEKHRVYVEQEIAARESAQRRIDDTLELAKRPESPAEPADLRVRRGSAFLRVGKVRLRPREPVFAKPGDEWRAVGFVDAEGVPQLEETIL